jgi:hypothetical protein
MHTKVLLFAYLFVALVLSVNVAAARRTETFTLGDVTGGGFIKVWVRGMSSTDAELLRQIENWQLEPAYRDEWYHNSPFPPNTKAKYRITLDTSDDSYGSIYILVHEMPGQPDLYFPAIFTLEELEDGHPGHWGATARANIDALLDELRG